MNMKLGYVCLFVLGACGGTSPATHTGGSESAAPPVTSGAPAAQEQTIDVLATFDPKAGELPEGLAVKDGFAYAGFAPLGAIAKVDLHGGKATAFGTIPTPVAGKGFMTGLRFGADGALYAALVSFDPSVQPGIYKVPASGGKGTLFAKDPGMVFPNGLVFDASGALFVTDSAAGAIFKITPAGKVTSWVSSKLLAGDKSACGGSGNGFDIGANGLAFKSGAFYATNTDKGTVLRIAVRGDGAGEVELAAGPDCAALAGADGIAADAAGDLVIAVNRQNKIVRLGSDGVVATVANGDALDFPASLDWNGATLVATTFAFANASSGKTAHPGLIGVRAK